MASLKERRQARKNYENAKNKPLGEGSRFEALSKMAEVSGAKNPEAVAGAVMWKKYGKKKGSALIRKGKKG